MTLPEGCLCGLSEPDRFGNRDVLEHPDCPYHGGGDWRPRERRSWTVCEHTGRLAEDGACPVHHGDGCLIVVAWVDNSHVRRDLAAAQADLDAVRETLTRLDPVGAESYAALLIAQTALEQTLEQAILTDPLRAIIVATIRHIEAVPAWP